MVSPLVRLSNLISPVSFLSWLENWWTHETLEAIVPEPEPDYLVEWYFAGSVFHAEVLDRAGAEVYVGTYEGRALDLVPFGRYVGGNIRYYDETTLQTYTSFSSVLVYARMPQSVAVTFEITDSVQWLSLEAA